MFAPEEVAFYTPPLAFRHMTTQVLLYLDFHDSADDSSVLTIPMSDVPKSVKRVLRNQPNSFDITLDEDGWANLVGVGEAEDVDADALRERIDKCERFFEEAEASQAYDKPTLLRNGVKVSYVVKKMTS